MNDKGTVLMEYVILCCFIGIVLIGFLQVAAEDSDGNAISGFFNTTQGYVGLGLEWAASVQLLHRAIALPIP